MPIPRSEPLILRALQFASNHCEAVIEREPARSRAQRDVVPLAGLEPARCCHHLILSQARLPIPPQGLVAAAGS
jgi:hypothetical protein